MYEHVLVPTDGSDATDAALDHAIDLAETTDATLHVLHVVDESNVPIDVSEVGFRERLEQAGEQAVSAAVERAEAAGVDVTGEQVKGTTHRTILDYADDHDIDLVVMATHGRTGLDRYLLGSVTEKIVRLSDAPVLTIRAREESAAE